MGEDTWRGTAMQKKLKISDKRLREINDFLLDPDNVLVRDLIAVVEKHGGVDEVNKKAAESGKFDSLVKRLQKVNPAYIKDLDWLARERDKGSFVSIADYRKSILGGKKMKFDERFPVTLEVSSLQYFPFLIAEAKQAIEKKELMPGRYIRVRCMKEQEKDGTASFFPSIRDISGTLTELTQRYAELTQHRGKILRRASALARTIAALEPTPELLRDTAVLRRLAENALSAADHLDNLAATVPAVKQAERRVAQAKR